MKTVRIAAAQTLEYRENVEAALTCALDMIRQAEAEGVRLLCFRRRSLGRGRTAGSLTGLVGSLDLFRGNFYFDHIWSYKPEAVMSTISVADAKAGFAGLVEAAANGEFVTITRHGKPAAVLVSVEAAEAAKKALNKPRPNFGDFLLTFPGGVELERNPSKMRDADL